MHMEIPDYIAIVSIGISIGGGIYAAVTNTKKYELAEQYKRELLKWYEKTISIIMELIAKRQNSDRDLLLAKLSAQIEIGRFYFPNIIKEDDFGKEKPSAYQGYRHLALDFLVHIYDILKSKNCEQYIEQVLRLERYFTSIVFECIDPNKRKKQLKRYADYVMPNNFTMKDVATMKGSQTDVFWSSVFEIKKNNKDQK